MNQLDEYILASCHSEWRKVAAVIFKAREQAGLADDDGCYETIAGRLCDLVDEGRLEAVGDLSNWRQSEVRLRS